MQFVQGHMIQFNSFLFKSTDNVTYRMFEYAQSHKETENESHFQHAYSYILFFIGFESLFSLTPTTTRETMPDFLKLPIQKGENT